MNAILPLFAIPFAVLLTACRPGDTTATRRDYSSAPEVTIRLGRKNVEGGLRQTREPFDGRSEWKSIAGVECQWLKRTNQDARYYYFLVDPTFKRKPSDRVRLEIEYFDAEAGSFDLQYDGFEKTYTDSQKPCIQHGTKKWRTAVFHLDHPRFDNSENGNADFRLRFRAPEFFLTRVTIRRGDEPISGDYSFASSVEMLLGHTNDARGLELMFDYSAGATVPAVVEGVPCRRLASRGMTQICFAIDDSFKHTNHANMRLVLEYYDGGCGGKLDLQYDGWEQPDPPYTHSPTQIILDKPGRWTVAEFEMPNGRFENHQNGEGDFRIRVQRPNLYVRRVTLTRAGRGAM